MPIKQDIEKVIAILDAEIFHTHSVFRTFVRLYRTDDATRKLLHESDAPLFADLRIVYLNYLSVAVARLLDPAKTLGRKNLSLFHLLDLLKKFGIVEHDHLRGVLEDCKKKAYNFIDPRNQLVAHLDLHSNLIADGKKAIPSFITKEFDAFYSTIGTFMNDIRALLGMEPKMYDWGVMNHGHGKKLLHRLSTAQEAIKNRRSNQPV